MAKVYALAHVTPVGPSAGSPCGAEYISRSKMRRRRDARRAIRDAQVQSLQLHDLLRKQPDANHGACGSKDTCIPPRLEEPQLKLADVMALLQDVSQRLCSMECRLTMGCGSSQVWDAKSYGIPADFLELQCNAVRKVQGWFRRKIKSTFAKDDNSNSAGEEEAGDFPAPSDAGVDRAAIDGASCSTSQHSQVPAESAAEWITVEPKMPPSARNPPPQIQ